MHKILSIVLVAFLIGSGAGTLQAESYHPGDDIGTVHLVVRVTPGDQTTLVLGKFTNNGGVVGIKSWDYTRDPFSSDPFDLVFGRPVHEFTPSTLRFVPSTYYVPSMETTCIFSLWGVGLNTILEQFINGTRFPLVCTQEVTLAWGEEAELCITYETEDHHLTVLETFTNFVLATVEIPGVLKPGTTPRPFWRNRKVINTLDGQGLPVEPLTGVSGMGHSG
ncbi:MAG: hypothetical protein H0V44_06150 [Planctomycetes bacterium]|nr:hypothetical protein [Planctomycetota bacterium]